MRKSGFKKVARIDNNGIGNLDKEQKEADTAPTLKSRDDQKGAADCDYVFEKGDR